MGTRGRIWKKFEMGRREEVRGSDGFDKGEGERYS